MLFGEKKLYGEMEGYDNLYYEKKPTNLVTDDLDLKYTYDMDFASGITDSVTDILGLNTEQQLVLYDISQSDIEKEAVKILDWKNYIDKIPNWQGVD
jgi:hypothetical protein